jgi:uncharacterized protein YprB with RNaseH-like and TPR domain
MNLEEKLQRLKRTVEKTTRDAELERQLEYLRRAERISKKLPAQRVPKGIEDYVEGQAQRNSWGEFFLARQALPFGRPYGKLRIGDLASADLIPLELFVENARLPQSARVVYLDTETTGLVGGTGTCAFLIGIAAAEGSQFVVRQLFLRDYPEEKAMLAALAEALEPYQGLVTFNGKTFDIPLLETRYALARMKSPFARLLHLDLLHPARRLWKLRLESCELIHLEQELLGISREGDVAGSEIPGIYFDYLRTGDARGLQPVIYHNALDVVSLAALTVNLASALAELDADQAAPSLDLFSLSRIFDRAGATEKSLSTCQRALAAGLPQSVETRALWHLALHHKRRRQHELAASLWIELTRREAEFAIKAYEELAIHYEHRCRDVKRALDFVEQAMGWLQDSLGRGSKATPAIGSRQLKRFRHRLERLRRKSACAAAQQVP